MARKKKKDDEIRTDGWMDTFADTMTLLLTFFILLYSISAVDSEKLKKLSEALQYSLTGDSSIEEVQSIDDLKVEIEKGTKYEDLAAKLNEIIEKNSLTDEIKIREEERGIVLQVDESILFDSGKAEIKSESINVLDTIAKIIQETDNEIVAEGNTDNVPINSAAYRSNWELSTERALSIVRYLIENKNINPNRISLKGYGEFNPIVPNDTPENKAKNRRVDILVVEERESKTENKNNNVENQITFVKSDLFNKLGKEKYDIIVSNPPYIKKDVIKKLSKDVQNEPIIALDGGKDGLVFYKKIVNEAIDYLKLGGYLCLEIGYDQKKDVMDLIKENLQYINTYSKKDLYDNDRIVVTKVGG